MQIQNKHVLITGANRGIGYAIARMCAEEKAHLHLVIRTESKSLIEELLAFGAQTVQVYLADLASQKDVNSLSERISKSKIDILINNAGQLTGGLIEEQPLEEIDSMFQVNLLALIQLTRAVIPQMVQRGSGKIINNASVSSLMYFPCASTYSASKAAVLAFTECIENELTGTGVTTLSLITPGIKTRMFDQIQVKYEKHLGVPTDSISPTEYAQRIKMAIFDERRHLFPTGSTHWGLWISKWLPGLFRWEVKRRFHR